MKNNNGITMIALVITIIVLIILAGVAINLSLGENGILKRAKEVQQRDSESSAIEKLELVLVDARIEKESNTSYNKENFLTQLLEENGITVNGDSVIVDNYNFLIDRENLVILENLEETEIKVTTKVEEYLGKNENDKYTASILLVVESIEGLQSVVIQNPDGTTFKLATEKLKLGKDMEVELNEEYILTVTTNDGKEYCKKIKIDIIHYTGTEQNVTLQAGRYQMECYGARGGNGHGNSIGGYGGYTCGTVTLTKSTQLFLYVGQAGQDGNTRRASFNGGAIGGYDTYGGIENGGSGGGATDIRLTSDLSSRIMVAGGGGGAGRMALFCRWCRWLNNWFK